MIKLMMYFNSHMHIEEQITNIIPWWIHVFIQNHGAYKHKNAHVFYLYLWTLTWNLTSSGDIVYKECWWHTFVAHAGYWFILRFCEHFTCLSYQIQIAIKLENISNWIASLSSYTSNKNNCKHEGQFVMKCISNTDFHLKNKLYF
jgi:hypothetical protein